VDVAGNLIGVRGVGIGGGPGSSQAGEGVVGEGTGPGVRGHGVPGVLGVSEDTNGVDGESTAKFGNGVRGLGAVGVLGEAFRAAIELDDKGRATAGVGVHGNADEGAGVKGTSSTGVGGVFESKFGVPLRLMPQEGSDKAPKTGQLGSFIVRLFRPPHQGDERQREVAELWFCYEGDGPGHDAAWAKVQMTPF
jgi:hypothetical protein